MERTEYRPEELRALRLGRQLLSHVFHRGDLDRLDQLVDSSCTLRHPLPWLSADADGFRDMTRAFHEGFPGFDVIVEDLVVRRDVAVIRWQVRGVHTGTWIGVPATGKDVTVAALGYFAVTGERITEAWLSFDGLGLLHQVGGLPAA